MGLGSLFHIECHNCKCINIVASGKRHSCSMIGGSGDAGKSQVRTNVFDVNTKLAAAMINAGIGESQMNNILSYINLPTIAQRTLKKREREISSSITAVAKDSCTDAVNEEIMLLEEVNRYFIKCTVPKYISIRSNVYFRPCNITGETVEKMP
ncbi:uncharacterized protein LOC128555142 [Mercenaria mercenaria]|uniref:uncharacterized protein LOC128555142 n=1 Tax=Mercenaria mercenaria TaxID=6596 RepID=UPI00234E7BE0|nr:uncharacterized protein LOC128555142 [Mercenaria mercenaria]